VKFTRVVKLLSVKVGRAVLCTPRLARECKPYQPPIR
jgi:hypothetical protein